MRIVNRTPYPDIEVERIVRAGMSATHGAQPATVVVASRNLPNDSRLGFTPFDRRRPMLLWVEPASRYPQPGARSWRDELLTSTLHETHHYRHPGQCRGDRCEVAAEAYAQCWRRRLRRLTRR